MADAPDPQEQKQEVTRATGSAAATEGAMSHLLHTHERQQQVRMKGSSSLLFIDVL